MDQQVTINIANSPWISCECGSHFFKPVIMLKKLSAWESPSGREEPFPVELYECNSCGKIPDIFIKRFKITDDLLPKKISLDEQ